MNKKFNNPSEFNNPQKQAEVYNTCAEIEKSIILIKLVLSDIAKIKNMPLSHTTKCTAIAELFGMIRDNI